MVLPPTLRWARGYLRNWHHCINQWRNAWTSNMRLTFTSDPWFCHLPWYLLMWNFRTLLKQPVSVCLCMSVCACVWMYVKNRVCVFMHMSVCACVWMYVKQRLLSGDVAGMILTLPFVLATRKLVLCYSHPTTGQCPTHWPEAKEKLSQIASGDNNS